MRLEEYLQKKSLTKTEFASLVDVAQSHISNIILRKKHPSIVLAKRIQDVTHGEVLLEDLLNEKAPSRLKKKEFEKTKT
jgi:transcriptional regulator with XRE-family HTH domain